MGKTMNFRASNNIRMFEFFKTYVHQTEHNEHYVDGSYVLENPGVIVDFQNIEHTYEIFKLLSCHWGGWNDTPTADEMYHIAKHWEEAYAAEIKDIGGDCIDFRVNRTLSEDEIDTLLGEIRNTNAEANCDGGYEQLKQMIREKNEFSIWWD
ncbi:MAG: DUF4253 domain-containing protein [Lachnospiraceae bacterium]|nr:DUF4253 domain-containing protein [Lachnospiraceae bacterium]